MVSMYTIWFNNSEIYILSQNIFMCFIGLRVNYDFWPYYWRLLFLSVRQELNIFVCIDIEVNLRLQWAAPWPKRLVSGLSTHRSVFDSGPVYLRFTVKSNTGTGCHLDILVSSCQCRSTNVTYPSSFDYFCCYNKAAKPGNLQTSQVFFMDIWEHWTEK
jgi:hypothetical protein